ncbi:SDR family oxidoreductase [Ochrobactrum quorumnocens]|uniref:SDR family oxidoreductase n=1 Tax=Ochrobactrum quorumnocens TaxID=271865 RepID=A0A5N1K5W7_9HYPH|nr:SDR family oxidoreductase [[Ochrobactrum] quorumnocens]KAA9371019.1 SDR family oxidoreductase [[Ochrobactrum] quorumnocens]MBD7991341.1 SDR family oxidoreductase [Ochrobactrum gallinarum]
MEVTIITGASDGIGAETARQIASRDGSKAAMVLAARNLDKLQLLAIELQQAGSKVLAVPTDVTDRDACIELIEKTAAAFGQIDTLIVNAGMSAHANFAEIKPENLQWMHDLMELNYWGSVWPIHAALPYLAKTKGRIVAVSSVAGLIGVPGRTAYSGTKFALSGFCEALRSELEPSGISVTIVYPGVVKTDIRKVGYGASGGALGISGVREDDMMSVQQAVEMMLEGISRRKREVLMTRQMRFGRWLKLIAPHLVDRMALKAIKAEFRPKPIGPKE